MSNKTYPTVPPNSSPDNDIPPPLTIFDRPPSFPHKPLTSQSSETPSAPPSYPAAGSEPYFNYPNQPKEYSNQGYSSVPLLTPSVNQYGVCPVYPAVAYTNGGQPNSANAVIMTGSMPGSAQAITMQPMGGSAVILPAAKYTDIKPSPSVMLGMSKAILKSIIIFLGNYLFIVLWSCLKMYYD